MPTNTTYATENKTRQDIENAVVDKGFAVESYALADKKGARTITVGLDGFGDDINRPLIIRAIANAINDGGYDLSAVTITAKGVRDLTDQQVLDFPVDATPVNNVTEDAQQ